MECHLNDLELGKGICTRTQALEGDECCFSKLIDIALNICYDVRSKSLITSLKEGFTARRMHSINRPLDSIKQLDYELEVSI